MPNILGRHSPDGHSIEQHGHAAAAADRHLQADQAERHKVSHRRHPSTPTPAAAVGSASPLGLEEEFGLNQVRPALPPILLLPSLPLPLHAQLEAALRCQRALLLQGDAAAPARSTTTQRSQWGS